MRRIASSRRSGDALLPASSGQYLKLYCRSTGKDQVVRATFCANIVESFIARRIVRKLGLEIQSDSTAEKTLLWGRSPIPPTSDFVDLACDAGPGDVCDVHRFYIIVEPCPFDILFGPKPSKSRAN
jgi:hypothetical protein